MLQSKIDLCLFIRVKVMCISCIENLFWFKDEAYIHELAILSHQAGVDLEQENDAASLLGVSIEKNESDLLQMR